MFQRNILQKACSCAVKDGCGEYWLRRAEYKGSLCFSGFLYYLKIMYNFPSTSCDTILGVSLKWPVMLKVLIWFFIIFYNYLIGQTTVRMAHSTLNKYWVAKHKTLFVVLTCTIDQFSSGVFDFNIWLPTVPPPCPIGFLPLFQMRFLLADALHVHTMPKAPTEGRQPHRVLVLWNNTASLCVQHSSLLQLLLRVPYPPSLLCRKQKKEKKILIIVEGKVVGVWLGKKQDQGRTAGRTGRENVAFGKRLLYCSSVRL